MSSPTSYHMSYPEGVGLTSTKTFHKFPQLPVEIRLLIWSFAIANIPSRTVCLKKKKRGKRQPIMVSTTLSPAPLSVNSESRSETIQTYGKKLMRISNFPFAPFWFNNEIDIFRPSTQELKNWRVMNYVSIEQDDILPALQHSDFSGTVKPINLIKRLIVDVRYLSTNEREDVILDCARDYPVLEVLTLEVCGKYVDEVTALHKDMLHDAKTAPLQGWRINRVPDFDLVIPNSGDEAVRLISDVK